MAEEIADVLDVVEAIAANCGLDMVYIAQIKEDKKQKGGGFYKKYVLLMDTQKPEEYLTDNDIVLTTKNKNLFNYICAYEKDILEDVLL